MKPALVIIDMIKGNQPFFKETHLRIIPNIKRTIENCRELGIPVIYANDSYLESDWIFNFMKRHAVRGTEGVEVIDELRPEKGDIVIEKRRFSAFFRTDLDITLRELGIDTVALAGINTHVCVLATAFDAVSNDFSVILLDDCCASYKEEIHEFVTKKFKGMPAFRVLSSEDFFNEIDS
jgi:nicotinamidase-related amidase